MKTANHDDARLLLVAVIDGLASFCHDPFMLHVYRRRNDIAATHRFRIERDDSGCPILTDEIREALEQVIGIEATT